MSLEKRQTLLQMFRTYNHRKLRNGELVLLGVAISNHLPLPEENDASKVRILVGKTVTDVCYFLTEAVGINQDDISLVRDTVAGHLLWRKAVATGNKPYVVFKGNANEVIDDLSGLPRYLDPTTLCKVADDLERANWLYSTFCQVTQLVLTNQEA